MAGKTTAFASSLLALILNATSITALAINATSSPATEIYSSLHTDDPGVSGNQSSSEAAYTGYARVATARTTEGWTISSNVANPVANIVFPEATGGSETETYWGLGLASTGTGTLLATGPISPTIPVTSGVTPTLTTASSWTET